MAFKKQAVIRINDKQGADDANIAFATIRNGYRAVYEKEAIVYETIPTELKSQYRQKVRRAALLIDAIIANKDFINSNRPFAHFFTLRAWMYLISPAAFCIGGVIFFPLILLVLPSSFARTFVINQFYLLQGLVRVVSKEERGLVWDRNKEGIL
jgi:cellulose synthase/poly-beta-1,6-N-acetylglucosamine synthase-like glycosyltransferase